MTFVFNGLNVETPTCDFIDSEYRAKASETHDNEYLTTYPLTSNR